jgi:hypothetical protein
MLQLQMSNQSPVRRQGGTAVLMNFLLRAHVAWLAEVLQDNGQ